MVADADPACPLCGHRPLTPFLTVRDVPVHVGVLWDSPERARACARGDLALALCGRCGLVTNTAFDPARVDYGQRYDNALHASAVFRDFEASLVEHLDRRYRLAGRTVVEVGCGDGHFLGLLCERSGAIGVGYDPSHDPGHADPLATGAVRFVRETYGPDHAGEPVDLLVCRQTLEHLAEAGGFLRDLHGTLGRHGAVAYFDVPNSAMPFERLSVWDLVYEHVHYFVAASLRYAFEASGYEVLDLRETYAGQFLSVEARPAGGGGEGARPGDLGELVAHVEAFGARFAERRGEWRDRLRAYRSAGTRVAVWGGGARAVSFFSMLGIGEEEIPCVVDVNPAKQGHFLPGGGQRIVAPEHLRSYRPEVVVVLNPLYTEEIGDSLRALGSAAQVVTA